MKYFKTYNETFTVADFEHDYSYDYIDSLITVFNESYLKKLGEDQLQIVVNSIKDFEFGPTVHREYTEFNGYSYNINYSADGNEVLIKIFTTGYTIEDLDKEEWIIKFDRLEDFITPNSCNFILKEVIKKFDYFANTPVLTSLEFLDKKFPETNRQKYWINLTKKYPILSIGLIPLMPEWYRKKYKHIETANKFGMFDYKR